MHPGGLSNQINVLRYVISLAPANLDSITPMSLRRVHHAVLYGLLRGDKINCVYFTQFNISPQLKGATAPPFSFALT